MYCELHCHTYYSLLDGASSTGMLLDRAAALGMPALAITDHDGLYGVVEFWLAARARGIRPVIGAEVTLAHGSHLTLLAENQTGYANLSRLISAGQLAGVKGTPHLTIEDVARHAEGLLCLSGCRQGAVAQAVLAEDSTRASRAAGKLADIFGRDRTWIELQRHWLPDDDRLLAGLLDVADAVRLGVVATNNVHYATPAGHRLHDVLTATRYNVSLAELGSRQRPNNEFYLKGAAEMATLFADQSAALAATRAIAERCSVSLDFADRRTPAFPPSSPEFARGIPTGETAFSYLYALTHAGLRARYKPVTPRVVAQLAHELSVIEAAGLADYFLIVWDIVQEARARGIRCQGRGSAASSLVAYLLGITPVDPLRHNLLFERFLSDRTDTTPDIDIDFAADRRDEIMAYVYKRYGADHTALVCNVVTYQARSAVRDVARALGFPAEELGQIGEWANQRMAESAEKLGSEGAGEQEGGGASEPHSADMTQCAPRNTQYAMRNTQSPVSSLQLLTTLASQLINTPRHLSVHVGGMLITARPLVEVVPLERATKPGVVVTQWNKDSVEDAGLIKIDMLSLATLGMVTEARTWIARRHTTCPDLDALPLDDPAIYRLLATADTIGCFQVESRAQAQMLPRLRPRSFDDLIIQVSIVRPGPIQGGMVHPYLRRRAGQEPVVYLHPRLEPILAETLGVIIFQEQVIRVAVALAGFTPGEADLLRRAMSRSRSAEEMGRLRVRFIAGALANDVTQEVAEEVFRQLQGFATYGFCKSHAASFALIAYQTLWLKAHYPAEFYCALLNHQPMGFYSPEVVIGDAKRHGIMVLRPHVNVSEDGCTLDLAPSPKPLALSSEKMEGGQGGRSEVLRLGLRYLHGLGQAGRERLLTARSAGAFQDLADFCRRTRLPRLLVSDLIRAGALDGFGGEQSHDPLKTRRLLLWTLGGLSYREETLVEAPDVEAELPDLTEREAMAWDYELLGLSPDDHLLRLLRPRLRAEGVLSAVELATQPVGRIVQVAGLVVVRQAPPTAKKHLFITLEDETGLVNLIIRPDLREHEQAMLHRATLLMAEGRVQREGRALSLLVSRVMHVSHSYVA